MDPRGSLPSEVERTLRALEEGDVDAYVARTGLAVRLQSALHQPLQSLTRASGRLLQAGLQGEQLEQAQLGAAAAEMVQALLSRHLELALRPADTSVERAVFDLQEALSSVLKSFAPRARARGLEFACRFDADLPPALVGDPGRLRHALHVLLEESLRSSSGGTIELRVEVASRARQSVELRFVVEGLEDDPACAPGLGSCGRLARQLDGRLWLELRHGRRGQATLTARCAQVPERRRRGGRRERRDEPWHVLFVAPEGAARDALAADLRARSGRVDEAGTTAAALATCGEAGTAARLVLVAESCWNADDEAAAALAEAVRPAPLWFASAAPRRVVDDSERALGVRGVLLEPVLPREILRALFEQALGPRSLEGADGQPQVPAAVRPQQVLVASGDPSHRELIRSALERMGHHVNEVADGLAAFECEDADVLLVDQDLPVLDAASLARLVRAREARSGGRLPVVALCDEISEVQQAALVEAGVDDCLAKPVQVESLAWTFARLQLGEAGPLDLHEPGAA